MTDTRFLSDRYRISGHLARGGMADVYDAEDTALGRHVAVKILHSNFASDEAFVARFRREAQAAANLTHPNIVSIFDWGEDGDTYYMVMELIPGRTLRDIRRTEGALLPRRAAEIGAEVAAALSVAHQAGVFHRDVKPGNIMLTGDGSVKVTDFGIARALDDSEELTRTGAVIGTATYFSPEQAQGLPADERSDVYSLGVVLYELVAGTPPFSGESPVAVAYQHVSEFAQPVSELNPDVPAGLEAIIDKAMEKSPDDRYQTAEEMRQDLLRFLAGETPVAMAVAAVAAVPAVTATQVLATPPPTVPPDETARAVAPPSAEPTRSQTSYILAIFGLLLALALGVIILISILRTPQNETATVAVPDFAGMLAVDAFEELQSLDLKVRQRDETSETVPEGFVIETDPVAGSQVEPESFITVVVSTGPQQFLIPNVIDLPVERAQELLEADGFALGAVEFRDSQDVEENTVLDQDPRPGTEADRDTAVNLIVSSGPFALEMPDVANMAADAALLELDRAGFTDVTTVTEFSEDILDGFVIRTEPPASSLVPRDAAITVFVSEGPEPFALPDMIGLGETQARTLAEGLGLGFTVSSSTVEVSAASGLDGLVAAQDPAAGSEALPGDEVTVRLGVLLQVDVPDLIGMTEEEATAALADAGLGIDVVGTTEVEPDSGLEGLVATQEPPAGSSLDDGSAVRVTLGVVTPPETTEPPPSEPPEPPPEET